jgi:hypothetical protein
MGDQSRLLKVGERVCWDTVSPIRGTVTDWRGVTIKWDDGQTNTLLHNDMARVERVRVKV